MSNKVFILFFLMYVSLVTSSLAPFITKCKWDDSKCLKDSTQKAIPFFADGIPELNVDKLDPLVIKHVDASTSNLKLIVTNINVTGLKNCEAKKITQDDPNFAQALRAFRDTGGSRRDIKNSKLLIKISCAVDFKGKYDMKGQLFILPIEGNGDLSAKVPKIVISVEVDISENTGKDGKMHWGVKSWKHTFELKEKSDVKFENLFPDNEFLRKSTEELISSNGNDVITEIGQPIIKGIVAKVIENIKKFFEAVAAEDLALE